VCCSYARMDAESGERSLLLANMALGRLIAFLVSEASWRSMADAIQHGSLICSSHLRQTLSILSASRRHSGFQRLALPLLDSQRPYSVLLPKVRQAVQRELCHLPSIVNDAARVRMVLFDTLSHKVAAPQRFWISALVSSLL